MPQVSKRPINPELEKRLQEILWKSLVKFNKDTSSGFIETVLTPTEKTMIAKRLAMALLLSRGWDHDAVSKYLKVSTSTITTIKNKLTTAKNGYHQIIAQIENDEAWEQIWLDLQQGLEEIYAGRVGSHWKNEKSAVYKKFQTKRNKYKIL